MKKVLTVLFIGVTMLVNAQQSYSDKMEKAFRLWKTNKSEKASNLFNKIGDEEKDKWVPYYYAGLVKVTDAFALKDEKEINKNLELASISIKEASKISNDNSEILLLKALKQIVLIKKKPSIYAQKSAPIVEQLYQEAMKLAPENPRVLLDYTKWRIHKAKYLKESTEKYKVDLKKSIKLFKNYKPKDIYAPDWGREEAKDLFSQCK